MSEDLQYPIGKYSYTLRHSALQRAALIKSIAELPAKVRATVEPLSAEQLATPYRPGGWTVRQLVHHIADSHLHAYIRTHWALTEDTPRIKAYNEASWAELPDYEGPVNLSLGLLEQVQQRWVYLLEHLPEDAWGRAFEHPETDARVTLDEMLGTYDWHGRHHLAHIERLIAREGW